MKDEIICLIIYSQLEIKDRCLILKK